MTVSQKALFLSIYFLFTGFGLLAQERPSPSETTKKKHSVFKTALDAVRIDSAAAAENAATTEKAELPFTPYNGKGVRAIEVRVIGINRNFADTLAVQNAGEKTFLEKLHRNTREWAIRDNIFLRPKEALNAYVLADNERYLRSLPFIQDARIFVIPVKGEPDSVDLLVITKDLFSITGEINDFSTSRIKAKGGDVNVAGTAQKIFVSTLWEKGRSPALGYELLYGKNNLFHTFINATTSYSTIHPNLDDGAEDERAIYGMLERPLVSQYSHFAGAITLAKNKSTNAYQKADSLYYHYNYSTFDSWIGYNIGLKKLMSQNLRQDRKFISIRYFQNQFTERPFQVSGQYDFRYDNKKALLAQFTFFRQHFYKTNYIYGFGSPEDLPHGYNVSFTTGWFRQADLKRPYAGVDANRYVYSNKGDFIQYFLKAGSFFYKGTMNDASLLAGVGMFSRVFYINDVKIRQYVNFSYTKLFNRLGLDPLSINNPFGVRYFSSDSARGDQRISLHTETNSFLHYKILGFKFGPFAFADMSLLTPENEPFSKSDAFWGLGGGLRTRNEQLVFGTIELRLAWFPRKIDQNSFKLTLTGNLRFRYNSTYIK